MFGLAVVIRDHISLSERLLKNVKPVTLKVQFKTIEVCKVRQLRVTYIKVYLNNSI
jgi:DNA-binding protein